MGENDGVMIARVRACVRRIRVCLIWLLCEDGGVRARVREVRGCLIWLCGEMEVCYICGDSWFGAGYLRVEVSGRWSV